jgi:hypothetical protein
MANGLDFPLDRVGTITARVITKSGAKALPGTPVSFFTATDALDTHYTDMDGFVRPASFFGPGTYYVIADGTLSGHERTSTVETPVS